MYEPTNMIIAEDLQNYIINTIKEDQFKEIISRPKNEVIKGI